MLFRFEEFNTFWQNGSLTVFTKLFGLFFFLNFFTDYLSLMETRYVLQWMEKSSSGKKILLFMIIDFFFTLSIFLIAFLLFFEGGEYRIIYFFVIFIGITLSFYLNEQGVFLMNKDVIILGICVAIVGGIGEGIREGIVRGIIGFIATGAFIVIFEGIVAGIIEGKIHYDLISKLVNWIFKTKIKRSIDKKNVDKIVEGVFMGIGIGIVTGIGHGYYVGMVLCISAGIAIGIVAGIALGVAIGIIAGISIIISMSIGFLLSIPIDMILSLLSGFAGYSEALPFSETQKIFGDSLLLHSPSHGVLTLGIFLYSTFFTSVWIILYAAACGLIKAVSGSRIAVWRMLKPFQYCIDNHPFHAIAGMMIFLFTLINILLFMCKGIGWI